MYFNVVVNTFIEAVDQLSQIEQVSMFWQDFTIFSKISQIEQVSQFLQDFTI